VLVHRRIDALRAGQIDALGARVEIGLLGERPPGPRRDEDLLPEVGHLALLVRRVERDQVGQGARLHAGGHRGEIGVQVRLELVLQHVALVRAQLSAVSTGAGSTTSAPWAFSTAIACSTTLSTIGLLPLRAWTPMRAPFNPPASRNAV